MDNSFLRKMKKLKVKSYQQTCWACPSQWDIFTDRSEYIYARYRWGHLTLALNNYKPIFSEQVGGSLDGVMDIDELKELTKDILDWSDA